MRKVKIKPPRSLKGRLRAVAKQHDFDSTDAVVQHFLVRGLAHYRVEARPDEIDHQLDAVVVDQGYSSRDELIEHLMLRGLDAYESSETDPDKLKERLRGLGYID